MNESIYLPSLFTYILEYHNKTQALYACKYTYYKYICFLSNLPKNTSKSTNHNETFPLLLSLLIVTLVSPEALSISAGDLDTV